MHNHALLDISIGLDAVVLDFVISLLGEPNGDSELVDSVHFYMLPTHRSVRSGQYTSFVFSAHLIEAGINASIGTVGDAMDNALMESAIGLYKTELITKDGPWKTLADVELATAEYVNWFSNKRLHTSIGGFPPAEHKAADYAQTQPNPKAGEPKTEASTKPGALQFAVALQSQPGLTANLQGFRIGAPEGWPPFAKPHASPGRHWVRCESGRRRSPWRGWPSDP
jgi:hypothetical protein